MKTLDWKYIAKNNFKQIGAIAYCATVDLGNTPQADAFQDSRQIAIIKAWFGDILEKITSMKLFIEPCMSSEDEFNVRLEWMTKDASGKEVAHTNSIGGEDLYSLISQVIVTAQTDEVVNCMNQ